MGVNVGLFSLRCVVLFTYAKFQLLFAHLFSVGRFICDVLHSALFSILNHLMSSALSSHHSWSFQIIYKYPEPLLTSLCWYVIFPSFKQLSIDVRTSHFLPRWLHFFSYLWWGSLLEGLWKSKEGVSRSFVTSTLVFFKKSPIKLARHSFFFAVSPTYHNYLYVHLSHSLK